MEESIEDQAEIVAPKAVAPKAGGPSSHELGHFWSSINWKAVMARKIVAPRMFMRSGLIRKDLLPTFAGEKDHPTTAVVENDEELRDFFKGEAGSGRRYVVKYSDSSNAYGMSFVDCGTQAGMDAGVMKVARDMRVDNDKRVVQEYIEPLLIRDWEGGVKGGQGDLGGGEGLHKFHIRALLLVVGDMDVYLFDECRVLIAPEVYKEGLVVGGRAVGTKESRVEAEGGSEGGVDDEVDKALHAHVTNQSFNKLHKSYDERKHNVALHECDELGRGDNDEGGEGVFKEKGVWEQIRGICTRLFKKLSKDKRKFMTLVNTWELFGLDFLVDGSGKVWVLEANPEPSMNMFGMKRIDIEGKDPLSNVPDGYVPVYSRRKEQAMERMKAMAAEYRREKEAAKEVRGLEEVGPTGEERTGGEEVD